MGDQLYQVYYQHGLKPGTSEEAAVERLSKLFKMPPERALKIIRKTGRAVKGGLPLEQARKYQAALDHAGLQTEVRTETPAVAPEPATPAPAEAATSPAQTTAAAVAKPADSPPPAVAGNAGSTPPPAPPGEQQQVDPEDDELRVVQVEFRGEGLEFFKIWIVNLFLTIITLGIYSAWAKVRNTQYFYGNTLIEGSSFNYTADPIVILKGRLLAVGFFVLYALANEFVPLLGLLFFVLLLFFIPWVVVRALAFNARNSMYRNIRFNFTGRVGDAARIFLLWPILIPFTLGLILPYIWFLQRRFIIGNSHYGTTEFRFHANAGDYYRIFLILLGILVAGGLLFGLATVLGLGALGLPLMIALYLLLFAYYSAATANLQYNSSTLAQHSFSMNLQTLQIAWLYFSNTLGILLTLGLFIPWAQVRMARYRAQCLQLHVIGSLDHFIEQEQQQVSALGEQVGEVFDLGVSVI